MAMTPQQVADKWLRNLSAAGESIKAGVMNVTVAPTQKAAERADAFVAGVQRSVSEGRWQDGLNRVSLKDWQDAMLSKGMNRISSGATAGKPRMQNFLKDFLPFQAAIVADVNASLPRGTLDQNIQRMTDVVRRTAEYRKRN